VIFETKGVGILERKKVKLESGHNLHDAVNLHYSSPPDVVFLSLNEIEDCGLILKEVCGFIGSDFFRSNVGTQERHLPCRQWVTDDMVNTGSSRAQ
jgi:hypothetical protein